MAKRASIAIPPVPRFPHPPIDRAVLIVVAKAIRKAWLPVAEEERKKARNVQRNEKQLNERLSKELNAIRRAGTLKPFTDDFFETPCRDMETADFTGEHIENCPDITIRLRSLRPGVADSAVDAIFIECKRVWNNGNLRDYFAEGIARFTEGKYAWPMSQAMMIAYLNTDDQLPEALERGLSRNGNDVELQVIRDSKKRAVRPSHLRYLASTCHQRTWRHQNNDKPGDIELMHVWLWLMD